MSSPVALLQASFIKFFIIFFPLINNGLSKYLVFLLVIGLVTYINYKFIVSVHKKRSNKSALLFEIILVFIEMYLILFLLWFIFIHFKTFPSI